MRRNRTRDLVLQFKKNPVIPIIDHAIRHTLRARFNHHLTNAGEYNSYWRGVLRACRDVLHGRASRLAYNTSLYSSILHETIADPFFGRAPRVVGTRPRRAPDAYLIICVCLFE